MSTRRPLRRFPARRRFYVELARIAVENAPRPAPRGRMFVSLMGGIGDLVNVFPTIEQLSASWRVDLGTGPEPYATPARTSLHVRHVYSPFVYKPIRASHRRLIEHVLGRFYERVVLLEERDSAWRTRGRHMTEVLGYPPEVCAALGPSVRLVLQERPMDDPAKTTPDEVMAAVEKAP